MTTAITQASDSIVKKVHLLKAVTNHQDSKVEDLAREVGISRSQAYNILKEFSKTFVMTEDEPNFPAKILAFYNNDLPDNIEEIDADEVHQLKPVVDRIMKRQLMDEIGVKPTPTTVNETSNRPNTENSYSRMDDNKIPDLSSNETLLRSILQNQKFVQPSVIEKFLNLYKMNEPAFQAYPEKLLATLKAMFGPVNGENTFELFRTAQPNYVISPSSNNGNSGSMDPMLMMMMMGGGDMSMLPLMMSGNMNPAALQQMMIVKAQKEQEKKAAKEAQMEFMDRALQVSMMRMVGGSMDDKKPLDPMALSQGGVPYSVREELDENGRARARVLNPYLAGQAQQPMRDPAMEIMLKSALDRETIMLQQQMKSAEPFRDLLLGLIPNFKTNANPIEMLSQVKQVFPEIWEKKDTGAEGAGIDALKLKTDTQLAIQAQQIELEKMKHGWHMEETDRMQQSENVKGWMEMLSSLGEKIAIPIAQSVMSGFGAGMLNKNKGPEMTAAQQQQQQLLENQRRQQILMARQQQMQQQQEMEQQQQQQMPQQSQGDPTMMIMMAQMQEKLKQQDAVIQEQNMRTAQLVQALNQQKQQQQQQQRPVEAEIDERKIANLPTQVLQEAYREFVEERKMNEKLGSRIEAELANRELYEGTNVAQEQPPVRQQQQERVEYVSNPAATNGEFELPKAPVIPKPEPQPTPEQIQQEIELSSDDLDMVPISSEEEANALESGDEDNRLADSRVIASNEKEMNPSRHTQLNTPSVKKEDEEVEEEST